MENNLSTESILHHVEALRHLLADALGCQEMDLSRDRVERFLAIPGVIDRIRLAQGDLCELWRSDVSALDGGPARVSVIAPAEFPLADELPSVPNPENLEPGSASVPVVKPRPVIMGKPLILPNGCVGRHFEATLQMPLNDVGRYTPETCDAATVGLTIETEEINGNLTLRLSGEPTRAGDMDFNLILRGEQHDYQHHLKWTVNPDPKSLWKNLPSNPEDPFWKPDSDSQMIRGIGGVLVAASQRGRSHGNEGSCRDDDFRIKYLETSGWYLIAVADGAGSSRFSRRGAQVACAVALASMENALTPERVQILQDALDKGGVEAVTGNREIHRTLVWETVGNAAFGAYKALQEEVAACPGSVLKDFATTLLLGAVKEFPGFGWFVMTYWVGDGGIGVYDDVAGVIKLMGKPDEGEFAGQTRFLTMSDLWSSEEVGNRIRFNLFPSFTAMVWMTDGITDPIFQTDNNLNDPVRWKAFLDQLVNEASISAPPATDLNEKLLSWLDFWSKGNHDDRTLAILF